MTQVPEAPDALRQQRRRSLNRLDRYLIVAVFLLSVAFSVGIVSLFIPKGELALESYGYDLSGLLIEQDRLVPTGMKRFEMEPLIDPEVLSIDKAEGLGRENRRNKFVVGEDRVVGVSLNGEARAYRLRELNWHEVINDTVGGIPIAVTFSPLCDSAVVFDRRIGEDVLTFRHSGLLYNSNLIVQDDCEDPAESSLWSQLQFQAVAGPRVGQTLRVLPMQVTSWMSWRGRYPETTIARGDERYKKLYKRNPYGHYLITGDLKFPVQPLPAGSDDDPTQLMRRIVAIEEDGNWHAWHVEDIATDESTFDLTVNLRGDAPTFVFDGEEVGPTVYTCYFAWYAMHGEIESPG